MPVLTWSWVAFHEFPYRWPASAPTFIQTCVFRLHNLVSLVFISFYTHWLTYLRLIRIAGRTPNRLICKKRSTIVSSWGPSIHSFSSIMQIIHDVLIHDLVKLSMQRCMFSSLEGRIRLSTNKISSKSIGPPWEVGVSHSLGDLLRERLTGLFRLHEAALWVDLACWFYLTAQRVLRFLRASIWGRSWSCNISGALTYGDDTKRVDVIEHLQPFIANVNSLAEAILRHEETLSKLLFWDNAQYCRPMFILAHQCKRLSQLNLAFRATTGLEGMSM